jgi:Cysteine rich repeat
VGDPDKETLMASDQRVSRFVHVAFVLLLLAPAVALAQGAAAPKPAPAKSRTGPCHDDVQRLCGDAKGQPGGVAACLEKHLDALAPECRTQLQRLSQLKRGSGRVEKACSEDLHKLCPDTKPGQGRLVRCLREHESELAPACKEALPARRAGGPPPKANPKP